MSYEYKKLKIKGRCVDEHRWVWEQAHGPIPPRHCVHHINGNKLDNRLENLELMWLPDHGRHHKPVERLCSIEGCSRKHEARGLCKKHYGQRYDLRKNHNRK